MEGEDVKRVVSMSVVSVAVSALSFWMALYTLDNGLAAAVGLVFP